LGANFVHGCDPDGGNVVLNIAQDAGLTLLPSGHERDGYELLLIHVLGRASLSWMGLVSVGLSLDVPYFDDVLASSSQVLAPMPLKRRMRHPTCSTCSWLFEDGEVVSTEIMAAMKDLYLTIDQELVAFGALGIRCQRGGVPAGFLY
jgi:hypothetical protein